MGLIAKITNPNIQAKVKQAEEEVLGFTEWWERRVFGPRLNNEQFERIRVRMWEINGLIIE